jgi:hypothetical protein
VGFETEARPCLIAKVKFAVRASSEDQVIAQDKRAEDAEYCCEDEFGQFAVLGHEELRNYTPHEAEFQQ